MKIEQKWQVHTSDGFTKIGSWFGSIQDPEKMVLATFENHQLKELLSCLSRRASTETFEWAYGSNLVRVRSKNYNPNIYCHEAYIPSLITTLESLTL